MIRKLEIVAPDGAHTGARWAGDYGPALVFVHGVGSTAAIWDSQLSALSNDFRCYAIELRGNGTFEDPDPSLISRQGFAQDVLAVCEEAYIDSFTLVGCSLGGVVGFELYRTAPKRFDAMVIVGSFAFYPNSAQYVESILSALRECGSMRLFAEQRVGKLGLPPDRLRETLEQMACKSVPSYTASTYATWTGDYRDVLPAITVPALVVHGERDAIAPAELSQAIANGIRDSRLISVPNAGHVTNADQPREFNVLLREFLTASTRP